MEEDKLVADITKPVPRVSEKVIPGIIPKTFAKKLTEASPSENKCHECCLTCIGLCCGCIGAYVPCCSCCNPYMTIPQGRVGILTRFGKAYRVVDPGLYFVNSMTEKIRDVDIRMCLTDVPRQMVMTKDNVSVDIDSIVYWHIIDPFVAAFQVNNVGEALKQRTMTTLRDTIGFYPFQTIIENRNALAAEIHEIIYDVATSWGVEVESILLTEIKVSPQLQETLSAAAKQQRLGESKVIAAKAGVEAAKLTREASDILSTSVAMQMRYFDTMTTMARNSESKLIFMPESMK